MTIEQKAEEYLTNNFCKKVDEELIIVECSRGERTRCTEFEARKEMLIDFAKVLLKQFTKAKVNIEDFFSCPFTKEECCIYGTVHQCKSCDKETADDTGKE